jgi:hypothetical protein
VIHHSAIGSVVVVVVPPGLVVVVVVVDPPPGTVVVVVEVVVVGGTVVVVGGGAVVVVVFEPPLPQPGRVVVVVGGRVVVVVVVEVVVVGGRVVVVVVVVEVVVVEVLVVVGDGAGPKDEGLGLVVLAVVGATGAVVVVLLVEDVLEVVVVERRRRRRVSEVEVTGSSPTPGSRPTGDGNRMRRPASTGFAGCGSTYPYAYCEPCQEYPMMKRGWRATAFGPVTSGSSTAQPCAPVWVICGYTSGSSSGTLGFSRAHSAMSFGTVTLVDPVSSVADPKYSRYSRRVILRGPVSLRRPDGPEATPFRPDTASLVANGTVVVVVGAVPSVLEVCVSDGTKP